MFPLLQTNRGQESRRPLRANLSAPSHPWWLERGMAGRRRESWGPGFSRGRTARTIVTPALVATSRCKSDASDADFLWFGPAEQWQIVRFFGSLCLTFDGIIPNYCYMIRRSIAN